MPVLDASKLVQNAYQKMMQYYAQADAASGDIRRKLNFNVDTSKKNRGKSLLNSNQSLSDRGLLNSGIALKRQSDLNSQYDLTDSQMSQNSESALADLARRKLALSQEYEDAKIEAARQNAAAGITPQADNSIFRGGALPNNTIPRKTGIHIPASNVLTRNSKGILRPDQVPAQINNNFVRNSGYSVPNNNSARSAILKLKRAIGV